MQSDNEKMLQEIVQNTEMGKNTLDELMGLTHDQRLKDERMRQKREYRRINQAAHTALDAIGAQAKGQSAAARMSVTYQSWLFLQEIPPTLRLPYQQK